MARAVAECTCEKCGKKFEKIARNLPNRAAADSYEDWAQANCTLCPDCYREQQKADNARQAAAMIAELGLPEIAGKSEKQVRFAADLRNRALVKYPDSVRHIADWLCLAKGGELDEEARKQGKAPEELVRLACQKRFYYANLLTIFETGEARQIIDALRD